MSSSLSKLFKTVGGKETEAAEGAWIETFAPLSRRPWALMPPCTPADANAAVVAAHIAFVSGPCAQMKPTQRRKLLRQFAAVVAADAERLADLSDKVANPFVLR